MKVGDIVRTNRGFLDKFETPSVRSANYRNVGRLAELYKEYGNGLWQIRFLTDSGVYSVTEDQIDLARDYKLDMI